MGKEKVEKGLIQAITPDSWTKHLYIEQRQHLACSPPPSLIYTFPPDCTTTMME